MSRRSKSLEKDSTAYTIKAKNDTIAYTKAYGLWYHNFKTIFLPNGKIDSNFSAKRYTLIAKDPLGADLRKKLSPKIVDSIEQSFNKELLKNLLKHRKI